MPNSRDTDSRSAHARSKRSTVSALPPGREPPLPVALGGRSRSPSGLPPPPPTPDSASASRHTSCENSLAIKCAKKTLGRRNGERRLQRAETIKSDAIHNAAIFHCGAPERFQRNEHRVPTCKPERGSRAQDLSDTVKKPACKASRHEQQNRDRTDDARPIANLVYPPHRLLPLPTPSSHNHLDSLQEGAPTERRLCTCFLRSEF